MKASETKIEDFMATNKAQFIIPVYQRNYDWSIPQCKQLLNDILNAGNSASINAHFIGSIVYIHNDIYTSSNIKEFTVIDGQQRLTTFTLLYLCLFHFAKEMNNYELMNEINETYLINKYSSEDIKLKLKPTDNNQTALKHLLNSNNINDFNEFSNIINNYKYFKDNINSNNIEIIRKGIAKLIFVEISLDRTKDDPQKIFESLNSTGLELSQADLIRNYVLMDLENNKQINVYQTYWEVIEKLAKDEENNKSKVSDFIRDYLTFITKSIPNKDKVYLEFKNRFPKSNFDSLEKLLIELKNFASHYNKLINPNNENDIEIRKQLRYIQRLEVNVTFPFLMKVYDDYSKSIINMQVFLNILKLIGSFTFRRFIVGAPTNALNKIFMNLYDKVDKDEYLESIQKSLMEKTGIQRFPNDNEIIETLKFKDVYNIKSKNRVYLLERLENYNNREPVNIEGNKDITIEHIFPQNPDKKWQEHLSILEINSIKEKYLNVIGNLTLSGNNGSLSNKIFSEKRDLKDFGYKDSKLWLNKYLGNLEKWDILEIEARTKIISERFLEIWEIPSIEGISKLNFDSSFYTEQYHLENMPDGIVKLYNTFKDAILNLGNIELKVRKQYIGFKLSSNVIDMNIQSTKIKMWLNMKVGTLDDPKGLCRDVSSTGHWGNGDYELIVLNDENLDYILGLIKQSIEVNR